MNRGWQRWKVKSNSTSINKATKITQEQAEIAYKRLNENDHIQDVCRDLNCHRRTLKRALTLYGYQFDPAWSNPYKQIETVPEQDLDEVYRLTERGLAFEHVARRLGYTRGKLEGDYSKLRGKLPPVNFCPTHEEFDQIRDGLAAGKSIPEIADLIETSVLFTRLMIVVLGLQLYFETSWINHELTKSVVMDYIWMRFQGKTVFECASFTGVSRPTMDLLIQKTVELYRHESLREYSTTLKSRRKDAIAAGDTYYFTGDQCPYGHIAPRFATTGCCRICHNENTKRWKEKQPKKPKPPPMTLSQRQARQQEYYRKNREKIIARNKKYREENRAEIKEKRAEWYKKNKEAAAEQRRLWGVKNAEKERAKARERYQNDPEKHKKRVMAYYRENKDKLNRKRKERIVADREKYLAQKREENRRRTPRKNFVSGEVEGSAKWSKSDKVWYGKLLNIEPDLVLYEAKTYDELEKAFLDAVNDYTRTLKTLNRANK